LSTFDPERLLAWQIPDIRQAWGPRENALYALSVGMSHDPLDPGQLRYTAGVGGWRTLPGMAFILGHPGFWAADPGTGIDVVRLVHGEESAEILAPLPSEGEILARNRVIGLADKGAEKGAVMYVEKTLVNTATDTVLARVIRTSFLRGNGGFGGTLGRAPRPLAAPQGTPDHVRIIDTRPEQALLYRWKGDPNPLHFDPALAARAGFRQPILHGLCSLGAAAQQVMGLLGNWDNNLVRAISGRFTAVVHPGEQLEISIWNDGGFRVRVPERDAIVINNGKVQLA